jgi:hypothetical protein
VARIRSLLLLIGLTLAAVVSTGCQSPYNSDHAALDGVLGPGTGEVFGAAMGQPRGTEHPTLNQ